MVMIQFSLPSRQKSEKPEKVDVVGGVLLAITLGLATWGLYNPAPDGKQVLPSYGPPLLIGALVAAMAFFVWERFARTRLIEPAGVHFRPFLAALGASLVAGAALMVTLVNVELFGQGVLGQDQNQAAFLLLRFLIALPIGALLGGWIATRIGDRIVACAGLLIAAGGYWLVSGWPADVLSAHHDLGFVAPADAGHRPRDRRPGPGPGHRPADVGDAAGGARRAARHRLRGCRGGPDDRHADRYRRAVRMGPVQVQPVPAGASRGATAHERRHPGGRFLAETTRLAQASREAYVLQYGEIFKITCLVCVVGALIALLISGRHEHADEPAETVDAAPRRASAGSPADDNPTQALEAPTQQMSSQTTDETARLEQPGGRHRPE